MAEGDVRIGEAVYIRSLSTHRAAIAEIIGLVFEEMQYWVHVRLVTGWHEWDNAHTEGRPSLNAGEFLLVDPAHIEPIRR